MEPQERYILKHGDEIRFAGSSRRFKLLLRETWKDQIPENIQKSVEQKIITEKEKLLNQDGNKGCVEELKTKEEDNIENGLLELAARAHKKSLIDDPKNSHVCDSGPRNELSNGEDEGLPSNHSQELAGSDKVRSTFQYLTV